MSKVRLYGATSGYVELAAPDVSDDSTLTLPPTFAGIGTNVVQAVKTDTFSTTSSGFTTVTGLSVTITPTSNTSKILLIAQISLSWNNDAGSGIGVRFSGGNTSGYIGDAASARTRSAGGFNSSYGIDAPSVLRNSLTPTNLMYLDSPATTSATTYAVQVGRNAGTTYVNRSRDDNDDAAVGRGASSITAIEVAA